MFNLKNISFQESKQVQTEVDGKHYGLGTMQATWGPVNEPIKITTTEELINKFGIYDVSNINDWFQCYNFLSYSNMLKVYRLAARTATPIFDGVTGYVESIDGSSHAHLFINSISNGYLREWNETDNGSNLFLKLNNYTQEQNEPTFGSDQILYAYAKYPGTLGNGIGITIANYYTDLTTSYVFRQYDQISVVNPSAFTVNDVIVSENGAYGTVISKSGDILQVSVTSGTFALNESLDIDNINTPPVYSIAEDVITNIQETEDPEVNYTLQEVFQRSIGLAEIGIIITYDDEIKESGIFSLDSNATNALVIWENDWVQFKMDSTYSYPLATDSVVTHQTKMPLAITNRKLIWGVNTDLQTADIITQLDKLKNKYFCDFTVMFMDTATSSIQDKLDEIKVARDDIEIFVNIYEEVTDGDFLITNEEKYIITNYSENIAYILTSDLYYLWSENADEYIVDENGDSLLLDM